MACTEFELHPQGSIENEIRVEIFASNSVKNITTINGVRNFRMVISFPNAKNNNLCRDMAHWLEQFDVPMTHVIMGIVFIVFMILINMGVKTWLTSGGSWYVVRESD